MLVLYFTIHDLNLSLRKLQGDHQHCQLTRHQSGIIWVTSISYDWFIIIF